MQGDRNDDALPARPDLDWYRKQAKRLQRAYRAGEPEAVARVAEALGGRERFALSDAQWLLAREHGFRSWAELAAWVATRSAEAPATLAARLAAARRSLADRGEARVESELAYGTGGEPVLVVVRKRPRGESAFLEYSDDARGVDAAGRPRGWHPVAASVVAALDLNLNRRGVVFVGAFEHQRDAWHETLATRVADASLAVYEALLELE
jgi:hypothetical protein